MDIALSTIIIFIFLLPGLTFRRFYFTEEFSKQYFKISFFELFIASFLPSFFFHFIWINLIKISSYRVDLRIIGQILTSKDYPKEAFENIQENLIAIILYLITILVFAAFSGRFCKLFIRRNKLDRTRKIFRFQNSWHYVFTGEFFEFPRAAFDLIEDNVEDIEFFYIDALIQLNEGAVIYDGILVDYELSKEGGLDTITLKEVRRRFIKDDPSYRKNNGLDCTEFEVESASNGYYYIPGHILILPYEKILNFNISYYKIEKLAEEMLDVKLVE
jgi:hypothetical protein